MAPGKANVSYRAIVFATSIAIVDIFQLISILIRANLQPSQQGLPIYVVDADK